MFPNRYAKIVLLCFTAGLLAGCASKSGKTMGDRWESMKAWEDRSARKMWDNVMTD